MFMFLVTVLCLFTSSTSAEIFNGDGDVYFGHSSTYGIRVIYRPQNYEQYSGDGYTAKIGFNEYYTQSDAESNYYSDITNAQDTWFEMTWSSKGKYYYADDFISDIDSGYWVSYAVEMYDDNDDVVYEDTNSYYEVSSHVDYCEIDEYYSGGKTKCSDALEGDWTSTKSTTYKKTTPKRFKRSNNSKQSKRRGGGGRIAGWIIFIIIVIAVAAALYYFCKMRDGWSKTMNMFSSISFFDSQPAAQFTPNTPAKLTVSEDIPTTTVTIPGVSIQTADNQQVGVNLAFGYPSVQAQIGPTVIEVNQNGQKQNRRPQGRNGQKKSQGRNRKGGQQSFDNQDFDFDDDFKFDDGNDCGDEGEDYGDEGDDYGDEGDDYGDEGDDYGDEGDDCGDEDGYES